MNDFSSQMESHQFIKELLNDLQPTMKRRYGEIKDSGRSLSGLRRPEVLSPLSEFEQYSVSVFLCGMRIVSCFETLKHIGVYLSYFSINKRYREAGIGRNHYINYHYHNYAINVVRIIDVALILTNETFRLGNPEKLCRLEIISKNSWVRSAGIDRLLDKLDSHVKPWREPRNLFIHRGKTLNRESMHMLEAFEFLIRQDPSITFISPSDVRRLYKSEVMRISKEFEKTEPRLFNVTSELLSKLLPIYAFWRERLKQTSSG